MSPKERSSETEKFADLVRPIAAALSLATGKNWMVRPQHYWSCTIDHAGGKLHVRNGSAGRLVFSGAWPVAADGSVFSPSSEKKVSVDASRDSAAIAKDVIRRLLTWYESVLPMYEMRALDYDQRRKQSVKLANELARSLGVKELTCNGRDCPRFSSSKYGLREVSVYHDGTVELKTYSLPADMAMAVVATLKERRDSVDV